MRVNWVWNVIWFTRGINIYVNLLRGVKKVVTLIFFLNINWKVRHLHAETERQTCTYTAACDNGKRNLDKSRTSATAGGGHRHTYPFPLLPGATRSTTRPGAQIIWQRYRIYRILHQVLADIPRAPFPVNLRPLRNFRVLIISEIQIRPAYKTKREVSNKAKI